MRLIPTPNGPIGPFFHFALTPDDAAGVMAGVVAGNAAQGERIQLRVRVLDSAGDAVTNAMIELWQADANGIYGHSADPRHAEADPCFKGFGRLASDETGLCVFATVKPGRVAGNDGDEQAPHISVSIFMPGLLKRTTTRIYFEGDSANASDRVLALVPAERRPTLMARAGEEAGTWHFDLHLTGARETVLFDV